MAGRNELQHIESNICVRVTVALPTKGQQTEQKEVFATLQIQPKDGVAKIRLSVAKNQIPRNN